jgi:pimeloyl-ACP methyl ester carboxylesterase
VAYIEKEITAVKLLRWVLAILGLLLVLVAGFAIYAWLNTAAPQPEALAAMVSSDAVEVTNNDWLVFSPKQSNPRTGFIFYPGAYVDPRAYAPPAHAIAAAGYQVVIVPMPLNLAVLAPNRAGEVITAFPEIERWVIGGHSLGGAMASRYALNNPKIIAGLVLWAAYPSGTVDLSDAPLVATSVYGTRDGLVSQAEIDGSRPQLPPDTAFIPIEGGNHAQFGWYGPQAGDLPATISHAEQQARVVAASITLLKSLR